MLDAQQITAARTARNLVRFGQCDFPEDIEFDVKWEDDYSADIGGRDGRFAVCTLISAVVFDPDTDNEATLNRKEMVAAFGEQAVLDAEQREAEIQNEW